MKPNRYLTALAVVLALVLMASLHLYFRCPAPAASVAQMSPEEMATRLKKARLKGRFIVIDTAANRLYLREGDKILLEAVCSTGSGVTLVAGERKWTFRTPVGAFRIINKVRDPVWRKPDWAFLEEGQPIPKNEAERYEAGALGEYALGIGDGYFIHGTLYTRTLGTNVTHGCIRLGDADLQFLARRVRIGTPVFIY